MNFTATCFCARGVGGRGVGGGGRPRRRGPRPLPGTRGARGADGADGAGRAHGTGRAHGAHGAVGAQCRGRGSDQRPRGHAHPEWRRGKHPSSLTHTTLYV